MASSEPDDSDFEEVVFEAPNQNLDDDHSANSTRKKKTNASGKKVRGPDILWNDFEAFDTADDYFNSDLRKLLKLSIL